MAQNVFQPLNLEEIIPDSSKVENLKSSSLVKARKTAKFYPVGAQQYTVSGAGTSVAIVKLQDSNGYLDLASTMANFKLTPNLAQGTTMAVLDEPGGIAILNRIRILCNNILMHDLQQLNIAVASQQMLTTSPDHYNTAMHATLKGCKYASSAEGGESYMQLAQANLPAQNAVAYAGSPFAAGAYPARATASEYNFVPAGGMAQAGAGKSQTYSIPLSYIAPFFGGTTFFSLRNAGQGLQIEFFFESPATAFVTGGANQVTSYVVDGINITADVLAMDPLYTVTIDSVANSAEGLVYPYNDMLITSQLYSTTQNTPNSCTIAFSKSTSELKGLTIFRTPANQLSSNTAWSLSNYPYNALTNFQVRLGSDLFPQDQLRTPEEMYNFSIKGFNLLGNDLHSSIVNGLTYSNDAVAGAGVAFMVHTSFQKIVNQLVHLNNSVNSSVVGGSINVSFTDQNAAGGNFTCWAIIHFGKVLHIAENRIFIEG